jgi:hypothetical protein
MNRTLDKSRLPDVDAVIDFIQRIKQRVGTVVVGQDVVVERLPIRSLPAATCCSKEFRDWPKRFWSP